MNFAQEELMSEVKSKFNKVKSRRNFASGLEAVLSSVGNNNGVNKISSELQEIKNIKITQIVPGQFQPRQNFEPSALQELSSSIAANGILQPILVRRISEENYEIIAGERRWRASQIAGLQEIPTIICNISDESALAFGLIENIQRQNLNPIEEATALKRLITDFKMTHEQVAESIGRSRTMVTNMLRLLNLTQSVQSLLVEKKLDVGHAKVLLTLPPEEQEKIALTIVNKEMSVRASERLVHLKKNEIIKNEIDLSLQSKSKEWGRALTEKLSYKTTVRIAESGSGEIVIHATSLEKIEYLINNLLRIVR